MTEAAPGRGRFALVAVGSFLLGCAGLFAAGALFSSGPATRDPDHAVNERALALPDGSFRITIDARDLNHWVPVDLGAGRLSPDPENADLLVRRHALRAPGGALELGPVPFESARLPADPVWLADEEISGMRQNPAFRRWYDYSYGTHLLSTKGQVQAVRLRGGRPVLLTIESYNCAPEGAGCLTLRYRFPGPAGDRGTERPGS